MVCKGLASSHSLGFSHLAGRGSSRLGMGSKYLGHGVGWGGAEDHRGRYWAHTAGTSSSPDGLGQFLQWR